MQSVVDQRKRRKIKMLNGQTENIINITLQVLLVSTWIAIPITMMLALMYIYKHYKKWENKEVKEAERIIVKKNTEIHKASETATLLSTTLDKLKIEVEELTQRKLELQLELGDPIESVEEEQPAVDLSKLTIKELQELAKAQGIRGFSRMKKAKLLEVVKVPEWVPVKTNEDDV